MSENLKRLTTKALTNYLKKYKQDNEKKNPTLDSIVEESNEILAHFKGVWPFDLFPDEVIIDKQAVTIIRHWFFGVGQKITCHFDDLVNAEMNIGPFFGSIQIYSKYFTDGEEDIKWFSRSDVKKIHALLQGLLIAKKEGVDIKSLSKDEILHKLYKIGSHMGL